MKHENGIIVSAVLALLLFNAMASGISLQSARADTQNLTTVQFENIGGGLTSLTNETTYSSPYAAKLVLPSSAPQGSGCMVLYPCNKTLNSLQSFQIYTSYTNALPRFVILLDTNSDRLTDIVLLSDYQFTSNGNWQITEGGQRWGWTEASTHLSTYGKTSNILSYWKGIYGNETVLSVGVALEYWAVKDSNGLDQPLYADALVINGINYNIGNQPVNLPALDDWPMYQHDPQRSGKSTSAVSDGRPLWQFNTGDKIRSSPSVANGIVYEGSNNGFVYALNAATGSLVWQYKGSTSSVESSPAVANGVVYVGYLWDGHNGYVVALNASDGALIWRFATDSGVESSPAVVDGIVYIGSWNGYLYALNATNGALLWSVLTSGPVFSSPAIVNGIVYVGGGTYIYALNAANGAIIWAFHTSSQVYSSPAIVNNVAYVGSDDGTIYSLHTSDGSKIWQANIGVGDHADDSVAVAGGIVYFGARNGYYAFNATSGSQIWFFTSPYSPRQFTGYVYSPPIVAGNTVYVGSCDSYLFALNAFDGSIIWSYRTGGFLFSSPAIANGVVYIGSYDGKVYAFGTPYGQTPATDPTPIPSPSPTPTATPAPTPPPNATANPQSTATSMPTQTPMQAPTLPPITQQETKPMVATEQKENASVDWLILGVVIVTGLIALISLVLVFRPDENPQ